MLSLFLIQVLLTVAFYSLGQVEAADANHGDSYDSGLRSPDQAILAQMCPDYAKYSRIKHHPLSKGPLELPYQRPHADCRKFSSPAVERVIDDLFPRFKDPDLAHLFRNAFPNTLDTTIMWHVDGVKSKAPKSKLWRDKDRWSGAQSFVVTGDINAEWLRDSANQLAVYHRLSYDAPDIANLILGAINTQAEFVIQNPYCNAFQPPSASGLSPSHNGQDDFVHPAYEPSVVFECKYELDSLASFLSLTNSYYATTGNAVFLTDRWFMALQAILETIDAQGRPTFDSSTHEYQHNEYTFQRLTNVGTETLNLRGIGNPLNAGTGLVRSAFRPSDDATIYGFFIPANAMMSVQMARTAKTLRAVAKLSTTPETVSTSYIAVAENLEIRSGIIRKGIYEHGVVEHTKFGKVFAFEIDGYGSQLLMDDANIPSLLSLPHLGFVDVNDEIYQNTRRMVLSAEGNPYYLEGPQFSGIGGPHIGVRNAWPMSLLVQALTSTNDDEIVQCLEKVKSVSLFGLINESVDVLFGPGWNGEGMTRSWFAWANSLFAQVILNIAEKRPHLLFADGRKYVVGKGFEMPLQPPE